MDYCHKRTELMREATSANCKGHALDEKSRIFPDLVTSLQTTLLTDPEMPFAGFESQACVRDARGNIVAECTARAFRRKRNRKRLDVDDILYEVDTIDISISEWVSLLADDDPFAFEEDFNGKGLIVAQRIEVTERYRGTRLWRSLMAYTLDSIMRKSRTAPSHYYLKAFPLAFERREGEEDDELFRREARKLRLLYGMYLGAEVITIRKDSYFMRCPVRLEGA